MGAIIVLLIVLGIVFAMIRSNTPKKEYPKKGYQDVFDDMGILDYYNNEFLLESIDYALGNEIFEYDEIQTKPSFPILKHSSEYQNKIEDLNSDDRPISDVIYLLIDTEGEENITDYMINEVYSQLSIFRKESTTYQYNRNFCTSYLKEIGLIIEEDFFVDGETILAHRTLLNESIVFKHAGTKTRLINHVFPKVENENEHKYNAVNYFEQILIKILRENTLYLERQKTNIFSSINKTENPDKIPGDTENHNLVNRISYALNKKISGSIPTPGSKPELSSIACESQIKEWLDTRDALNVWIDLYQTLLEAYLNKDNLTFLNVICRFERENYLLSADTRRLVDAISALKSEVLGSIEAVEDSASSLIGNLSNDIDTQLNEVKDSANAAAAAATAAAVQATRALNK
jgi:hypothetical protein